MNDDELLERMDVVLALVAQCNDLPIACRDGTEWPHWPHVAVFGYVVARLRADGRYADAEWLAKMIDVYEVGGRDLFFAEDEAVRCRALREHRRAALRRARITAVIDGDTEREPEPPA